MCDPQARNVRQRKWQQKSSREIIFPLIHLHNLFINRRDGRSADRRRSVIRFCHDSRRGGFKWDPAKMTLPQSSGAGNGDGDGFIRPYVSRSVHVASQTDIHWCSLVSWSMATSRKDAGGMLEWNELIRINWLLFSVIIMHWMGHFFPSRLSGCMIWCHLDSTA